MADENQKRSENFKSSENVKFMRSAVCTQTLSLLSEHHLKLEITLICLIQYPTCPTACAQTLEVKAPGQGVTLRYVFLEEEPGTPDTRLGTSPG